MFELCSANGSLLKQSFKTERYCPALILCVSKTNNLHFKQVLWVGNSLDPELLSSAEIIQSE